MRIGLETLSCDASTGIGRIVGALAREFSVQGHEIHVVTSEPCRMDDRIHVHRTVGFPRSKALSKVLFRAQEERHLRSLHCDVTYSFGVGRGADVVAAQSCHLAGKEILKSHSKKSGEGRNWGVYDFVSLGDERALLTGENTKLIIACSHLVKDEIVQYYGVHPDRIVVIPNGVALRAVDRSAGGMASKKKKWGVSEKEKTLLFMGNEFARKGLRTVLESFARLGTCDVRLLVAGKGNTRPYASLAGELGITGSVTFLGSVQNPEELFGAADLFVLPTVYEPFGMVVIEAMAAGVPVIASRTCGAVEGMTHGHHGFFLDDPSSAEEVVHCIRTLLTSEDLRKKLSAAGCSKAAEFTWDKVAARTLEVLHSASREQGQL
jgi:UDP-glucose:(heptosyl)LPS alpha-1,3-glucosyltransferase